MLEIGEPRSVGFGLMLSYEGCEVCSRVEGEGKSSVKLDGVCCRLKIRWGRG